MGPENENGKDPSAKIVPNNRVKVGRGGPDPEEDENDVARKKITGACSWGKRAFKRNLERSLSESKKGRMLSLELGRELDGDATKRGGPQHGEGFNEAGLFEAHSSFKTPTLRNTSNQPEWKERCSNTGP